MMNQSDVQELKTTLKYDREKAKESEKERGKKSKHLKFQDTYPLCLSVHYLPCHRFEWPHLKKKLDKFTQISDKLA